MIRIGLSGTNWTGKTETIKRFMVDHPNLNIETISLSSFVAKCPFPMGKDQTLEGSQWMLEQIKTLINDCKKDIQLFDRTPLDILAFTLYAEDRSEKKNASILEDAVYQAKQFDTIFYLGLWDNWPVNVNPSLEKTCFARLMDSYLRKAISEFEIQVMPLPWQLSERNRLLSEHLMGAISI